MSVLFHVFRHDPQVVEVPAGGFLFHEGEPSDGKMYVLAVGKAKVLLGGEMLEHVIPSGLVGEMGLIEPESMRSASVQALTDCDFVGIDQRRFHFLVEQMPHFAMEVMRILASRLRHSDERLGALLAERKAVAPAES